MQVLLAILNTIEQIAQNAQQSEVRADLLQLLEAESRASAAIDRDRERISQRCTELADLLLS